MTPERLLAFLREHRLAVEASVAVAGGPQAAVVGFAVSDEFEVVFDTLAATRKVPNLRNDGRIALVIGGLERGDERTVQYEGVADEPTDEMLDRSKALYFAVFPDGRVRQRWPGITYIRVRPTWVRYSDFGRDPPEIVEFDAATLRRGGREGA
jgi:hypothetical protein